MKKVIAIYTILATICWIVSPALTAAVTGEIDISLVKDASGGAAPIVKAKWEMNGPAFVGTGTDAVSDAGAQFSPSGQYQVSKKFAICGIATDPDGVSDINAVYADVYFPVGTYLGTKHELSRTGCGQMHGTEITLTKLSKAEGIELFCNKIKNLNESLPTFDTIYFNSKEIITRSAMYNEVCATDGELMKETAYVYCGDKILSYEDPSGDYRTLVMAQDKSGVSGSLDNYFRYLPAEAFDVDYSAIAYGSVKLNTEKIINGNLAWNSVGINNATVRNVGNTRIEISVTQDDMGLGMTDTTNYNVGYKARIGSNATWAPYAPNHTEWLTRTLDLSDSDEMDYGITVTKFPPTVDPLQVNFTGHMILGVNDVPHLTTCPPPA
jgi:hypothetical protein